ncbi:MAG: tRNA lysidine(34) synthetase TilS [Peptococcaceae bacterium]|nr:tRNA lysidine(34) synthetase TilS [Peptococcaceae bacterium]
MATDVDARVLAAAENSLAAHVRPGEKIVAAVSGGCDSMALLDMLWRLREKLGFAIVVCHVHHHLRAASDAEWDFVAAACARYGLPFIGRRVDVAAACAAGGNLEAEAHRLRHEALEAVRQAQGAQWIALGHHADDRAETVLMHILRGTSLKGLAAMPLASGQLLRPLITCSRTELEAYARARGIRWVTDESNADTRYLRNDLRHRVLPELEEINPGLVRALGHLADSSACAWEYLAQEAQNLADSTRYMRAPSWCLLERAPLLSAHAAVFSALLQALVEGYSSGRSTLRYEMVAACRRLLAAGRGRTDLGGGVVFEVTRRWLYVGRRPEGEWQRVEDGSWRQEFLAAQLALGDDFGVRAARSGDEIAVKNLGHKSLKKIFQEHALPPLLRQVWPVVYDIKIKEVIWIPFLAESPRLMYYNSVTFLKVHLNITLAEQSACVDVE